MLDALPSAQAVLPPGEVLNDFQGFIVIVNSSSSAASPGRLVASTRPASGISPSTRRKASSTSRRTPPGAGSRTRSGTGSVCGTSTPTGTPTAPTPPAPPPPGACPVTTTWSRCGARTRSTKRWRCTGPPRRTSTSSTCVVADRAGDRPHLRGHRTRRERRPRPEPRPGPPAQTAGRRWTLVLRRGPAGTGRAGLDQHLPLPAGAPAAVLVTRVFDGTSISNTRERPIEVFEVAHRRPAGRRCRRDLIIRHDGVVQDRPHIAKVRLLWNQPVPGDPNGQFDLSITPWDAHAWETVNVWVNSPQQLRRHRRLRKPRTGPARQADPQR